jgi:GDP-L-fucose synthase
LGKSSKAGILMDKKSKFFVAGHTGMVGSAIVRKLKSEGYNNLILKHHRELDLLDQKEVEKFYDDNKPDCVFIAAAKVGGIHANNTYRGRFIYENLQMQNNLIHYANESGVKKLLFLGSSCIYPRNAPQPMKEEYLLTGELEPTNEPYALAKISGIKMCESYFFQYGCQFFSVMPTNAYGPNDNYDLETSHALPALIRKIHKAKLSDAKEVTVWGTGKPTREFIHVDDIADACIFVMGKDFSQFYEQGLAHINLGTGFETSIDDLVNLLSREIVYQGKIKYDNSMPDGTPRKVMDVTRINDLGWKHKIDLEDGLAMTYASFVENLSNKNISRDAIFEKQTI